MIELPGQEQKPLFTGAVCLDLPSQEQKPLFTAAVCLDLPGQKQKPLFTGAVCLDLPGQKQKPLFTGAVCLDLPGQKQKPLFTGAVCLDLPGQKQKPLFTGAVCLDLPGQKQKPLLSLYQARYVIPAVAGARYFLCVAKETKERRPRGSPIAGQVKSRNEQSVYQDSPRRSAVPVVQSEPSPAINPASLVSYLHPADKNVCTRIFVLLEICHEQRAWRTHVSHDWYLQ